MLWSRRALASVRGRVLSKAGVPAPVVSTIVVGGLVMSKKIALITVGAVIVLSASLWVMLNEDEAGADPVSAVDTVEPVGANEREVASTADFQEPAVREVETLPPREEAAPPEGLFRLAGKVFDARGVPVAGVSVLVDGSTERSEKSYLNGLFFIDSKQRFPVLDVAPPYVLLRTGEDAAGEQLLLVVAPQVDLAGTVVDEEGDPLPGISVKVEHLPLVDFPGILDRTVSPSTASTMTDARGWFTLERLPEGQAVVRFEGACYSTLKLPVDRETAGSRLFTMPSLKQGVRVVSGTVVDHLSQGVAGATVGLGEHRFLTDERGEFNLVYDEDSIPHEGATLYAAKTGYRTAVVPGFGINETALFHVRVELRLEGKALEITGRLLDAEGGPIDGAVLRLWHEPYVCGELTAEDLALTEGTGEQEWNSHAGRAFGLTDAAGAFSIGGLSDRSYRFRIYDNKRGFAMTARAIPAGSRDVEIRLPADAFRESLTGYVVNRSGEPMAGLEVTASMLVKEILYENGSTTSCNGIAYATTDEHGAFMFTRLCRLDDVFLSVRSERTVTRDQVTVPPGAADTGVKLVVEERCHFRVELSDPGLAQSFRLLDEEGETVSIELIERGRSHGQNRQPLVDGKSQILTATERAATLVLEGEKEIHIPVRLDPDKVTVVRY
jgi:protocatechuate 3,4-dioxygenase beta subunit